MQHEVKTGMEVAQPCLCLKRQVDQGREHRSGWEENTGQCGERSWWAGGGQSPQLLTLCYEEHRHIQMQLQKEESQDLKPQSGTVDHSVPTRLLSHTVKENNHEQIQVSHVSADLPNSPPHAQMSHSKIPTTRAIPSVPTPLPV